MDKPELMIKNVLAAMEWSFQRHTECGTAVEACPICKQVNHRHYRADGFIAGARGHKSTCKLASLLYGDKWWEKDEWWQHKYRIFNGLNLENESGGKNNFVDDEL